MNLRKLELKDAHFMLSWMHDKNVVAKLRTNFEQKTLLDAQNFILSSQKDKDNIHLAVVSDKDEYMGTVSLKHIKNKSAEFAITIRSEAMGKGYAWFGMEQIIEKGFEELELQSIYWCVSKENGRAIKFYNKHGFHEINEIPEDVLSDYRNQNDLLWYAAFKENH